MTNGTPSSESPAEEADWEAIARYLAGESPAAEADAVRRWIAAEPGRAELVAALDRSLDRVAFRAPEDLDVEAALRRVRARRDEPVARALPTRAPRPFERPVPRWRSTALRAAAAVALVAGGGALVWQTARMSGRPAAPARTYATAVGERDSVRLPDGSRVLLGPGSRLTVASGYGAVRREVELRGEAYFDVRHDAARPFSVRAGAALIRDVGTVFAVHSDPGDGVRVVVTEGAVELRGVSSDSGALLRPGDVGVLEPGRGAVVRRAGATDEDLAWTRGRLVFREAPLAQVSADLRRWYGVELRVADSSLAGRHVTASFAGEPAGQVLDVIALTLGASVERRGDTAVLRAAPGGAGRR